MLDKKKELQVINKLKEKGYDGEWSLCRIKVGDEYQYFFRLISETEFQERSDIDCEKVIVNYLLDLPDKKG